MKKKIFLASYGGGHSRLLIPLIHKLQEMNHYEIEVLGLTASAADYLAADIPFYGMVKLMESFGDDHVLQMGRALLSDVSHSAVSLDESIAYLGLSYRELVEVHGESRASKLYKKYGRQAFLPINLMKRWLQKIKPDLVIATSSPRMERATLEAASNLGISSLCLVDLFCMDEYGWVAQKNFASKICVIAEPVKNLLISKGRPGKDIEVTGSPAFEHLIIEDAAIIRSDIRAAKGWKNDFVILWAVTDEPHFHPFTREPGFEKLNELINLELKKIVKNSPNWRVIIRSHPLKPFEFKGLPNMIEMDDRSMALASLLASVDCVVTSGSTVGFEAAILRVPVISLRMSCFYASAPYDTFEYGLGVDKISDLKFTLEAIFYKKWEFSVSAPKQKNSVNNVIRVIDGMISGAG